MNLLRKLELYCDKKLVFGNDVVIVNRQDGKGEFINLWNIDGIDEPELKLIPEYTEQQYTDRFGESEKSIKERLDKLEEVTGIKVAKK